MRWRDEFDHVYYVEDDTLYVEGVGNSFLRKIGKLATNLTTGKCNLIVHRKPEELTNFGWMISMAPFVALDIDKLVLIVDDKIYLLEWSRVKGNRKAWSFNPDNGMEMQMIIPLQHWDEVKQDKGIIV